jgi:hypothetical protein
VNLEGLGIFDMVLLPPLMAVLLLTLLFENPTEEFLNLELKKG